MNFELPVFSLDVLLSGRCLKMNKFYKSTFCHDHFGNLLFLSSSSNANKRSGSSGQVLFTKFVHFNLLTKISVNIKNGFMKRFRCGMKLSNRADKSV